MMDVPLRDFYRRVKGWTQELGMPFITCLLSLIRRSNQRLAHTSQIYFYIPYDTTGPYLESNRSWIAMDTLPVVLLLTFMCVVLATYATFRILTIMSQVTAPCPLASAWLRRHPSGFVCGAHKWKQSSLGYLTSYFFITV
jgi:hypothetical protein